MSKKKRTEWKDLSKPQKGCGFALLAGVLLLFITCAIIVATHEPDPVEECKREAKSATRSELRLGYHLKFPETFEYDRRNTFVSIQDNGMGWVEMRFTAENSMGLRARGTAYAEFNTRDCGSVTITNIVQ